MPTLFAFPPQKRNTPRRPPIKGKRLKKLSAVLTIPKVSGNGHRLSLWYGRTNRLVEIASGNRHLVSRRHAASARSAAARSAIPKRTPTAAFLATISTSVRAISSLLVQSLAVEVTFEEPALISGRTQPVSDKGILEPLRPTQSFSMSPLGARFLQSRKLKP